MKYHLFVAALALGISSASARWAKVYTTDATLANPDGSIGFMIANDHSSARTATIRCGQYFYTVACPAKSIVSGCLGLAEKPEADGEVEKIYEPRYLSGSFNNWPTPGNDRSILMDVVDGVYTAVVDFPGEGRFCIYGRNWKPKYCLHTGDPVITDPVTDILLHPEGDSNDADIYYNLNGRYRVTFDESTLLMSLTSVEDSGIAEIVTDSTPVYYDLYGRRAHAPTTPGIYIRVQNGKTSKVVF